jgi:hypothetical protein
MFASSNLNRLRTTLRSSMFLLPLMANLSVNRTPCQLRWQVPSALRAPVAGYLKRYAL